MSLFIFLLLIANATLFGGMRNGYRSKRQPRRIRIVCSVIEQSTAALEACAMIVHVLVIYHEPYHIFWLPQRGALVENAKFRSTVASLNIEPYCNIFFLFSLSLRFCRVLYMGGMN
jgi:hypothetical protein